MAALAAEFNPARLAAEIATADALSNGRLMLGVGAGYQPYEFERFGVDIKTNLEMTEEFCDILDRAFSQDFFSYNGKHYQIPKTHIPARRCRTRCRSTSPAIPRRCSALRHDTATGCRRRAGSGVRRCWPSSTRSSGTLIELRAPLPASVRPHLLDCKQAPDTRDKSRKLSRELRVCCGSISKIQQFLCNEIIERRPQSIAPLDFLSRFALLNPNFVKFPRFQDGLLLHRSTDGSESWNRQLTAARRTGSQMACRPNDPPRRGYGRSDCPSLRSRRIVAASRPPILVSVLRSRDGHGLAFFRDHDQRHRRVEARPGTVGAGARDPCLRRTREIFTADAARAGRYRGPGRL